MLRVRPDDRAASGQTAHLDDVRSGEHEGAGVESGGSSGSINDLHFGHIAAILRRRSGMITSIALIGMLLAIVIGLLIAPKYTATAQLVVEAPVSAAESAPGVSAIDVSIDTHVTLLSSPDHLQRVIESLSQDPEFRAETRNAIDSEPDLDGARDVPRTAVTAPSMDPATETLGLTELKRRLGVWIGELRKARSRTVPRFEEFRRNTVVIQERRSRVISVAFTSPSPQRAAAFANRIVQLYVDELTARKEASASRELAQMDDRVAEAKYEAERAAETVQKAVRQKRGARQDGADPEQLADSQLRELLRHASSSAQRYDSLLRARKALRDQQESSSEMGIQLILAGVPTRPSSHNPILFVVPSFILFAILGCWLAVVRERLDRRLRDQQETADVLGMPCIALIPRISRRNAVRPDRYFLREPFSRYAEAIRSVIAPLELATPSRNSKVVLVCSSIPGEGKTALAMSLAAYLGALGRRVLLIGLDPRPGSPLGNATGTANALPENLSSAELVRRLAEARVDLLSRVDLLPLVRGRTDPLTLFASEQLRGFVRQMRERYDAVIIDGPPVLGAVEARLLPAVADKLLFVVKWGSTRREVSRNAVSLLRDAGCLDNARGDFAMSVLTRVDLREHARYRYGDVGEFMVRHKKYYSALALNWGRTKVATWRWRTPPRDMSVSPVREAAAGHPKAGQVSGLDSAGEGTDGRSP